MPVPAGPAHVDLLDLPFDRLDEAGAVEAIVRGCVEGHGGWACPVNVDVLRQHTRSDEVRALVREADLVLADGMPIVWASRLRGDPLPERVAGSSMLVSLTAATAAEPDPPAIFLLGGAGDSAAQAADELARRHPRARLVGTHSPAFGFEDDPVALREIETRLAAAAPDLVFVGLGFPKQERLIRRLRPAFPAVWFVSCGISFSFVAGDVRRAPRWLQRLGFEWLHRLAQEPRRLARRYLVDGPPFVVRLLVGAGLGARLRRRAGP